MCAKLGHAIFQPFSAKEIRGRINGEGGKMCVFQRKTGHISKTVIDMVKVTINH